MATCGTGGWTGPLPGDPDNNSILTAVAVYGGIEVSWTYPTTYPEAVSYVELYRGVVADFSLATLHRIIGGNSYLDSYEGNVAATYFYWIRIVSQYGTQGDPIGPAYATAEATAAQLLDILTGQVTENTLDTALKTKINKVNTIESNLATETAARIADSAALATSISGIDAVADLLSGYIVDETNARIAGDAAVTDLVNSVSASNSTLAADLAALENTVTAHIGAAINSITEITAGTLTGSGSSPYASHSAFIDGPLITVANGILNCSFSGYIAYSQNNGSTGEYLIKTTTSIKLINQSTSVEYSSVAVHDNKYPHRTQTGTGYCSVFPKMLNTSLPAGTYRVQVYGHIEAAYLDGSAANLFTSADLTGTLIVQGE